MFFFYDKGVFKKSGYFPMLQIIKKEKNSVMWMLYVNDFAVKTAE